MNERKHLESLLCESSIASLEEIAESIGRLKSVESEPGEGQTEIFSPIQIVCGCQYSDENLWNIWHCYYYTISQRFSLLNCETFWRIIEMLPSHSVCRELVWSALNHVNIDKKQLCDVFHSVPLCINNGKWNGSRSAIYVVQKLCDIKDDGDFYFEHSLFEFLASRTGEEQQALIFVAYAVILCALNGEQSPKATGKAGIDKILFTRSSILHELASLMGCRVKSVSTGLLRSIFGLDIKKREKEFGCSIETGRILKSNGSYYTLALAIVDALNVELSDGQLEHFAGRCLLCPDITVYWDRGIEESPVARHLSHLISKASFPSEVWKALCLAWRPAVRRKLLKRTGDEGGGVCYRIITMYLSVCRCLAKLVSGSDRELAFSAWREAWYVGCAALRGHGQTDMLVRTLVALSAMFQEIRPQAFGQKEEAALVELLPEEMPESRRYGYNRECCIMYFTGKDRFQ